MVSGAALELTQFEVGGMNRCPGCQAEFSPGTKFCTRCGTDLIREFFRNPVCPKCGKKYPEGSNYCDDDGSRLVEEGMLEPRCVICKKKYTEDMKYCPDDGGAIIAEAFHKRPPSPFAIGKKLNQDAFIGLTDIDYAVKRQEYLSRGWELFKENAGGFIGFSALILFINFALHFVPMLGFLVQAAVYAPLFGGFYIVAFKMIKRQKVEFPDFFKGFNYFLPLLLGGLLTGFFTMVGLLLLLVPGIYLAVSYVFTLLIIVDRGVDFWQAMEISRKIAGRNWLGLFLFLTVLFLINVGGALLFGVGLLVTIPFTLCAVAVAYDDIIGIETDYF